MSAPIAVVFDFDDTLLPDSTSALLKAHGVDPTDFWTVRARELVDAGYDPPMAYLNLLIDMVGDGRPLGELTNAYLETFGSTLDETWYPGLPEIFDDLRQIVAEQWDVSVELYIISGGLEPIIRGSKIVQQYFDGFYGCHLGEDRETGLVSHVKRSVTFTEKTRFLFEINKGIPPSESATQPQLVNRHVPSGDRRIPMRRMIYVGDGLTDIPCFSLVKANGGLAVGVYKRDADSAKQAFQQFLVTRRVDGLWSPDYGENADLGSMLRAAVSTMASQINLERELSTQL